MQKKFISVMLTVALATTMLFTGCGSAKTGATNSGGNTAKSGGILNADLPEIKTLDSSQAQDTASSTPIGASKG